MTVPALRPLLSATVTALVMGSVALAGAPSAFAAPGDNGDVKIHKDTTDPSNPKNEPKVCKFHLAAFNFDGLQEVSWEISPQPPKAEDPHLNGKIILDSNGDGHTTDLSLPDGMYKLDWTWVGENGAGKHKVFRVDCDVIASPPPTNGGNGHHKPPHGPVGAGGGGSADTTTAADEGSAFGVGSALVAGLAGTAGLILIRRARRRNDGAA